MLQEEDLIELSDGEYQFLSEKFDIMSPEDVSELPRYIVSSRKANFTRLVNMAISNELDETQRRYVSERFFENLTVTDIARRHNVSRQSVYRCMKTAGDRLFEVLKYAYFCGFSLLNPPQNIEELLQTVTKGEIYENN